jgi:hypothetical protein
MPRTRSRGAHRAGRVQWQQRDHGLLERRSLLRESGSIPSSGQGAGGGDGRPRGAFGLRSSPAAGLLPSRGWASLGLSHEHQMPRP